MVRIGKHYIKKKGPLQLLFICKTIFWASRRCCLFHNTKELHSFSFVQSWINFLAFLSYRMEVVSEKNQNKTNQLKGVNQIISAYRTCQMLVFHVTADVISIGKHMREFWKTVWANISPNRVGLSGNLRRKFIDFALQTSS